MAEYHRSIPHNSAWAALGTFCDRGATMLAMMIYARLLGKVEYGLLLMAMSTVNLIGNSFTSGPCTVLIREVARCRDTSPEQVPMLFKLSLTWFGGMGLFVTVAILACGEEMTRAMTGDTRLALPLMVMTPIVGLTAVGNSFSGTLQGLEQFPSVSLAFIIRGAMYILSAVLLTWTFGLAGAATASCVASLAFAVVTLLALQRIAPTYGWTGGPAGKSNTRRLAAMSVPLMMMTIAQMFAELGSQAILARGGQHWPDIADLGVARQLAMVLPMLSSAIAVAAIPALSAVHSGHTGMSQRAMTATYLRTVWLSQIPVAVLMFGTAPLLLAVLYGPQLVSASSITRQMMVAGVLFSMTWTAGPILTSRGRLWTLCIVYMIRSAMILALTILLVPAMGVTGIGVAYILGEMVALLILSLLHWHALPFYVSRMMPCVAKCAPMLAGATIALLCTGPWNLVPGVAGIGVSVWIGWSHMDGEHRAAAKGRIVELLPACWRKWV